jgi:uncharacterized protein YlxP (DUF503 family)
MNAEQTELFRKAILRVLDTNRSRFGLGVAAIGHLLAAYSFTVATFRGDAGAFREAIADALQYLDDKGLTEEVRRETDAANRAWRLTNKGIAHVDEHP